VKRRERNSRAVQQLLHYCCVRAIPWPLRWNRSPL
jgi:hypothetical protein